MTKKIVRNSIFVLLVFSLAFPSLAFSKGGDKLRFSPKDKDPHMTGCKLRTPAEMEEIRNTTLRLNKVHLNDLGLERVNKVRKNKKLQLLDKSIAVKRCMEIEGSIGETDAQAAMSKSLTKDDYLFLDSLPASADNSELKYFPPIRTQGPIGSCAQFATVYYAMTHMYAFSRELDAKNGGDNFRFSPKWTYTMLNDGQNQGTFPDAAYPIAIQHGVPTWSEFTYDTDYQSWCLDPTAWRNSIPRRFLAWGTADNVDTDAGRLALKQLLVDGYVVNFTTFIYSWQVAFVANDPSTPLDNPFIGERCAYASIGSDGAHAMTIVGYNDNIWVDVNNDGVIDPDEKGAFKVANSWDTWWGNNGFFWVSYDSTRHNTILSNQVSFIIPRPAYTPQVICEFKVNHKVRNQLAVWLGISGLDRETPSQEWVPRMINHKGGSYPFYGTSTPPPFGNDGTFTFDFTDLLPTDGSLKRYYISMRDSMSGDPAILKDCNFFVTGKKKGTQVPGLPITLDRAEGRAYISLRKPVYPPRAFMRAVPSSGRAPLTVNFAAIEGTPPPGDPTPIAYSWKFGDGTKGYGQAVTHTYTKHKTFHATLVVTYDNGDKAKVKKDIFVQP